jgi:coenzyme F420-reducing hydrogenase delta subunit
MCTGRVDPAFIFRAFQNGADGVVVGGCWPGECHYITEGNYDALSNMHLCRRILAHIGIRPERLRLEWMSAAEGARFAEVMDDFVTNLKELGELGPGEDIAAPELARRLEAVQRLVPYLKLVERGRLRVPVKSEEAYNEFYASEELDRLFRELVAAPLAVSRILVLLKEGPLSTGEISEQVGLNPSEVAKHMQDSSRQGLVRFDTAHRRYALA